MLQEQSILDKQFIDEWNKVTGALKLEYGDILDKIGFVSVESEWGKRTDIEPTHRFVSSTDKFKADWNAICAKLKANARIKSMGLAITPMAEVRSKNEV